MRQDRKEGVARHATDAVRLAHPQPQAQAQFAQDLVTDLHAVGPIQASRAIQVDQHQRYGMRVTPRLRGLRPQALEDGATGRCSGG